MSLRQPTKVQKILMAATENAEYSAKAREKIMVKLAEIEQLIEQRTTERVLALRRARAERVPPYLRKDDPGRFRA